MIKATILGADTECAGELIRILVHHPDVEIVSAVSAACDGERVDRVHRGLTGDTDLVISAQAPTPIGGAVFVCAGDVPADLADDARVIDMTGAMTADPDWVLGVGELNRKALVRGATRAAMPDIAVQTAVAVLMPVIKEGMLDGEVTVTCPRHCADGCHCGAVRTVADAETDARLIMEAIRQEQPHFSGTVKVVQGEGDALTVSFFSGVDGQALRQVYDKHIADHNFCFTVDSPAPTQDVTNTNKCLMHIAVDGHRATVTATIDPRIKGCAGAAVHIMNLLYGLHERTGLALKALGR